MIGFRIAFLSLILLSFSNAYSIDNFDQVVIWGHKLHSHTHSYIHEGFYRAFTQLGYRTLWLNDNDSVQGIDFSRTLFITEGQVDNKIPLRSDSIYLIHNPIRREKYESLKTAYFQVYTDSVLDYPHMKKIDTCIYFDLMGKCLYMPWATDLLPHEIEQQQKKVVQAQRDNAVYWIGTIGEGRHGNKSELDPFIDACKESGIAFIACNPDATGISQQEHRELILKSYMAPAIVGAWQKEAGYIPCRIFKNISYGQMGITNSYRAYEILEKRIVYNPDSHRLFYDAKLRLAQMTAQELIELMNLVKTRHTYINRIQVMLSFLNALNYL